MAQNINFSGSDQIQTPQYPNVQPPSQEMNEEVFQAKGDLKALVEYENSPSRDRSIFLNDDENHSVQNKESLENSSKEIATSNSNEEKEGPPQDSDIRQLIREECCVEVSEEQKQSMEDTILELVKICRQKELLCMHDNVEDLIESALNSKLLSINSNSQRLDNKELEVKNVVKQPAERGNRIEKSLQNFRVIHKSSISLNTSQISSIHAVAPILSTKKPKYSPSMGYENPNTTLETESDEIIKSGVEELVPILSENEVTLEDKRECDVPVCENFPVCDDHSEIFSDSNNDDDISVYDDFEDIQYVEVSLSDPEIVSVEEENIIFRSNSKLLAIIRKRREVVTPRLMLMTLFPSMIRFDLRLSPIRRDAEFDAGKEIPVVMNDKDEDVDYFSFIFVIYPEMFPLLLSAESEDTIFDPGISV
uniref:Uncharacterized protein n=1 Tax=Tanacetum cinerariifolium TaxID=118510 RepID=A0A6L2MYY2_TANCI|nr:hypothetical protein [Tanacetum cinerariifolium]